MSSENEEIVRRTYQRAEEKDIEAFIGCFTDGGTANRHRRTPN
jgi:hypothetical protein